MRRVYRTPLPLETQRELYRRQKLCTSAALARREWKAFRQSAAAGPLIEELHRMAGGRNRCFYCSDSRGTDVDHFKPIGIDTSRTFTWPNHLWICTECNRHKGGQYPTAQNGMALLIDPSAEDPWASLILDRETALVAARYVTEHERDVRAVTTLKVLEPINHEAVATGRRRSIDRLERTVAEILCDSQDGLRDLLTAAREDDYGVAAWFALWEGSNGEPFATLRTTRPHAWRRFVSVAVIVRYGT